MAHSDESRISVDWSAWKRILRFARPHRRDLIVLVVTGVATAICDTLFPLVTRSLIDRIEQSGTHFDLRPFVAAYAALTAVLAVEVWLFIHCAERLAKHVSYDIRQAGFARLQELSFSYFDRRPVGWLMARMTSDCDRLSNIVAWGSFDLVWGGSSLVAITFVMFMLNWQLACVVLLVVPPLMVISRIFQRRILLSAREVRKTNSTVTATYNESVMGVRTTKAFGRERENLNRFVSQSDRLYGASVRNALQSAVYLPLVLTLGSIGAAMALMYGGVQVLGGTLSLGTLLAFMIYARHFFDPVQEVAAVMADLQMAQASAERVLGLVETVPEIRDSEEVLARVADERVEPGTAEDGYPSHFETVEFRGVGFEYEGGQKVLSDFSLTLRAGETIALVGATGAGKTTIAGILSRFYEPTDGQVLFDGVDYRSRSLGWLESITSVVLQAPHLFRGSVRENIRYGRLEATDEEVENAARLVAAHDALLSLESGYDTDVGEGGGRLSSGQRQLVSLARAVIRDPQILVLDEATSSVDAETEQRIQRGLESAFRGRLSVIIAHRLTTVRSADRILLIDSGRIAEQGTHQELMALRGLYHQLYSGQSMDETVRRWQPTA